MKNPLRIAIPSILLFIACNEKNSGPSKELINQIDLKRGNIISCGTVDKEFGKVVFEMTCDPKSKADFELAIEILHSFEYDEAEKAFANVIDKTPDCAMAYWGVAMSNFHPLWAPPTEIELKKGTKAIEIANTISDKSDRETAYINAIGTFYKDWNTIDHRTRCSNFEKAMEQVHIQYPNDKEASIFYALALDAAAEPMDKTYSNQKKAGALLNTIYPGNPNHPGIIHILIHTYDYPGLADQALTAARKYAAVAPSSAHALHMPSHIFTRLGLWDECIQSNLVSVASAKCYAEQSGIKGHWDEEMHGLDYLVYAYLQKGATKLANEQLNYLKTIKEIHPANFKVAYAFASIPSRILLETKNWNAASVLEVPPANFSWDKFPWQYSIIHFTRLLGAAHLGKINDANSELQILNQLRNELEQQKDSYKARQVAVQIKAGEAWIDFANGKTRIALANAKLAADMEDSTEKHSVTPGEVLPARELFADMLMEAKQYEYALISYEAVLTRSPNRFNSLYSAGAAAGKIGKKQQADFYYNQLLTMAGTGPNERPEIIYARSQLNNNKILH